MIETVEREYVTHQGELLDEALFYLVRREIIPGYLCKIKCVINCPSPKFQHQGRMLAYRMSEEEFMRPFLQSTYQLVKVMAPRDMIDEIALSEAAVQHFQGVLQQDDRVDTLVMTELERLHLTN